MILAELRDYLAQHRQAAIGDLANRFGVEPDALRGMLDHWTRKGQVRRVAGPTPCAPCGKCDGSDQEVYIWLD